MEEIFPDIGHESLSPEMLKLLRKHFWCDFSDLFPALAWEDKEPNH